MIVYKQVIDSGVTRAKKHHPVSGNTSNSQCPPVVRAHGCGHHSAYDLAMRPGPASVHAQLSVGEKALNIIIHVISYANDISGAHRALGSKGRFGVPAPPGKCRIDFGHLQRVDWCWVAPDSTQNGFESTRAAWPDITSFRALIWTVPSFAGAFSLRASCRLRARPWLHGTAFLSCGPSSIRPLTRA